MPRDPYTIGSRVIVDFPEGGSEVVTILEGPIVKDGKVIYKVDHGDFENWYPVEDFHPVLKAI